MKKLTPILFLHYELLQETKMSTSGLCSLLEIKFGHFTRRYNLSHICSYLELMEIWNDEPLYEYTTLRQNILLLLAAYHNEL